MAWIAVVKPREIFTPSVANACHISHDAVLCFGIPHLICKEQHKTQFASTAYTWLVLALLFFYRKKKRHLLI